MNIEEATKFIESLCRLYEAGLISEEEVRETIKNNVPFISLITE